MGYTLIDGTEENVKAYRSKYRNLSHVKTGAGFKGYILLDDDTVVGFLQCNVTTGYVVALEVNPKYQRQGIATELLTLSRTKFNCHKLSVRKSNTSAISLYEKEGYSVFKEDGIMLYMRYDE